VTKADGRCSSIGGIALGGVEGNVRRPPVADVRLGHAGTPKPTILIPPAMEPRPGQSTMRSTSSPVLIRSRARRHAAGALRRRGLEGPALLRKKANRPAVIRFDGERIDVEAMLPRFKLSKNPAIAERLCEQVPS
jgi:hypothetical protein